MQPVTGVSGSAPTMGYSFGGIHVGNSVGVSMTSPPSFHGGSPMSQGVAGMGVNANSTSLALIMLEHGIHATRREILGQLLSQFAPIKETDVAQVLGMMAATHGSVVVPGSAPLHTMTSRVTPLSPNTTLASSWQVYEFIDMVQERCPYLNWTLVVQCLDYPEFFVSDYKGAEMIIKAFYYATAGSGIDFPVPILCKPWLNIPGQLSFIRSALLAPVELLTFAKAGRKIIQGEDVDGVVHGATKHALCHLLPQHWNSLELLELLCSVTESEFYNDVRPIFELASKQAPELLCLGLACFDPPWNSTLHTCLIKLITGFLTGQPSSPVVLPRLWRIHPHLMLLCMTELHRLDPACLSRLLDIAQELKILPAVLDARPFAFSIDMAALASRREHLNLDKWLTDAMAKHGDAFVRAALDFVAEKCFPQGGGSVGGQGRMAIPLPPDVLAIFLRALSAHQSLMSYESVQLLRDIQAGLHGAEKVSVNSDPRFSVPSAPDSFTSNISAVESVPAFEVYQQQPLFAEFFATQYSKDIEEEANACYERIYSHEVSVHEIIDTMARLKNGYGTRDVLVFHCMVHNLLDEYRFFPKYPEKELTLTGVIFGLLIQNHLLTDAALYIALRFILDALRQPRDAKMFKFGLTALLQFQGRLAEWPPYCRLLLEIPALTGPGSAAALADLSAYLEAALAHAPHARDLTNRHAHPILYFLGNGKMAPTYQARSTLMPLLPASLTTFSCLAQERLVFERSESQVYSLGKEEDPVITIQEPFLFLLNNLSVSNVAQKCRDVERLVTQHGPSIYRWLAGILVHKRIATEPNNHNLYLALLPRSCAPALATLRQFVLYEIIARIRRLLDAERTANESGERAILRHLGLFLGHVTLGRDLPILHWQLPLKELLLEAVHLEGRLLVVVPFVCKVLEGTLESRIFAPHTNAWTNALLRLLGEMYHARDLLKLNLKFEIEVLCKLLHIDIATLHGALLDSPRCFRYKRETIVLPEKQQQQSPLTIGAVGGQPLTTVSDSLIFPGILNLVTQTLEEINEERQIADTLFITARLVAILELACCQAFHSLLSRIVGVAVQTAFLLATKDFDSDAKSEDKKRGTSQEEECRLAATHLMQLLVTQLLIGTIRDSLYAILLDFENALTAESDILQPSENQESPSVKIKNGMQALNSNGNQNVNNISGHQNRLTGTGHRSAESEWLRTAFFGKAALLDGLVQLLEPLALQKARILLREKLEEWRRNQPSRRRYPVPDILAPSVPLTRAQRKIYELDKGHSGNDSIGMEANQSIQVPLVTADLLEATKKRLCGPAYATSATTAPPTALGGPLSVPSASRLVVPGREAPLADHLMYHLLAIDRIIVQHPATSFSAFPSEHSLRNHMKQILLLALHPEATTNVVGNATANRDDTCLLFTTKIIHILYKTESVLGIEVHVVLLDKLCELSTRVTRQVAAWVLQLSRDDSRKWNVPVTVAFFLSGLLSVMDYDVALANALSDPQTPKTTSAAALPSPAGLREFAVALIQRCVLVEPIVASPHNFARTLNVLKQHADQIEHKPSADEASFATTPSYTQSDVDLENFLAAVEEKLQQDVLTPELMAEQVHYYFHEWLRLTQLLMVTEKNYIHFVHQVYRQGFFAQPGKAALFFTHMLDLCCLEGPSAAASTPESASKNGSGAESSRPSKMASGREAGGQEEKEVDEKAMPPNLGAVAKLVVYIVQVYPHDKITLFSAFLSVLGTHMITHRESAEALSRYTALVHGMLVELPRHKLADQPGGLLCRVAEWLHAIRPAIAPVFAVPWLDMAAHRFLIPRLLLATDDQESMVDNSSEKSGHEGDQTEANEPKETRRANTVVDKVVRDVSNVALVVQLLSDALIFLRPFLLGLHLTMTPLLRAYYRAILRLFLLLLHDFPEFLAAHHLVLVQHIPLHCVQLRNLILSAFPRHLKLLDPFTPNLKMSALEACQTDPPHPFAKDLPCAVPSVGRPPSPAELVAAAVKPDSVLIAPETYLTPTGLVNQPLLHGTLHTIIPLLTPDMQRLFISKLLSNMSSMSKPALGAALAFSLFHALANQLRFPNTVTLAHHTLLLAIFAHPATDERHRELLTRVLLERLIVNRPHPWGLLVTFIELIRASQYNFWNHAFTHCSPDIERLFESVARSCMLPKLKS
jgi:hypothetical protein